MPPSIACLAPVRTASGTSVSHTPWARLMPCTLSQATDIARISDCTVRAARRLRERGMGDLMLLLYALIVNCDYKYLRFVNSIKAPSFPFAAPESIDSIATGIASWSESARQIGR